MALKSSPEQVYRVGCVIVNKNMPISCGFNNMKKTHPRARRYKFPFLHAELSALIGVDGTKLNGAVAYVGRVRRNTRTGLAKPCSCCEDELRRMGIKRVYFTTDTEEIESIEL